MSGCKNNVYLQITNIIFVYIVPNCSRAIMSVPLFPHCTTNYYQAINCLVCSPNALSLLNRPDAQPRKEYGGGLGKGE